MKLDRRIAILLFASIAANFFLAGALTIQWGAKAPRSDTARLERFDRAAASRALSEDEREIVANVWRQARDSVRREAGEIIRLRREVQELLLADHFDAERFEDIYSTLQERSNRGRMRLQAIMGEVAAALPDQARQKYFQAGFSDAKRRGQRQRSSRPE